MKLVILFSIFFGFAGAAASAFAETQRFGQWQGEIFDLGGNRLCKGGLKIEKAGDGIAICFAYDCRGRGGGQGAQKWTVKNAGNQLTKDGKRIGFVKGERLLLEETYPLNNDYQFEFKEDSKKVDILIDSAIGDYKGTLSAVDEKNVCPN